MKFRRLRSFVNWAAARPIRSSVAFVTLVLCLFLGVPFLVRVLILEAFHVPTGAMATAIRGRHIEFECPGCSRPMTVSTVVEYADAFAVCVNCACPIDVAGVPPWPGDRIAVVKRRDVQRWDLIVYKVTDPPGQNWIHRLIGLPGELLDIHGGEIFINQQLLAKPIDAMPTAWRFVHDTKYRSTDVSTPRAWVAAEESEWAEKDGTWHFAGAGDTNEVAQRLVHSRPVTDVLDYNLSYETILDSPDQDETIVHDLKLVGDYSTFQGAGYIQIAMQDAMHRWKATLHVDGQIVLEQSDHGGQSLQKTTTQLDELRSKGQLTCFLRDQQFVFSVNGQLVGQIRDQVNLTEFQAATAEPPSSQPLEIVAHDCRIAFHRLQLFRDIYYHTADQVAGYGDVGSVGLGDDQYFVIGDNSKRSRDSRLIGPIAADTVIGRAQSVYWPPSRIRRFRRVEPSRQ